MRKLLLIGVLSIGASAMAQDQYSYPLTSEPILIDAYGEVTYYTHGAGVYNLQNFPLSSTHEIAGFKVSPDGSLYAVITRDKGGINNAVTLYGLWSKGKKLAATKKLGYAPQLLAFMHKSPILLVADDRGEVHALNAKLQEEYVVTLDGPTTLLAVSNDDYYLAVTNGNSVEVWSQSVTTGHSKLPQQSAVNHIAFSDDSHQMAVLTAGGQLVIYDLATMEQINSIEALGDGVSCCYHPDGKYIAVVTGDNRISILNLLNPADRSYIESDSPGVKWVNFGTDRSLDQRFLVYNTVGSMIYHNVDYLSPMRSKLVNDKLQEMMDDWEKQLPGETYEDYQLRVNDETRLAQMQLFEQELTTQLALDEMGSAQMRLGSYDMDTQMLAMNLGDGLGDIFLQVPQDEVGAFLDPMNLEFRNPTYGLNAMDEYELKYVDVYNKVTGKSYVYNNLDGQFIDYVVDAATYAPLEIVSQATLEESSLTDLTNDVMTKAKDENILTEHTHISVSTDIVTDKNDDGENIRNYEVGVTYTVDQDFSAMEDYGAGKYEIKDSPAGTAMMDIVKQAMSTDFAKYLVAGKRVNIIISGSADATPIRGRIAYNGCYGEFVDQPIMFDGKDEAVTVTTETGITDNEQLAFVRAAGVYNSLFEMVPALKQMRTDIKYDISVSDKAGSEYRKVGVKFIFVDAFDN